SSGTSYVAYERNASGQVFATEQQQRTMWAPAAYEAQAYDAMTVSLLAVVKAAQALDDPSMVTPTQVRDALGQMNDPTGQMVRTGPTELKTAVQLIAAGMPINYDGASGPVDFDAVGDVRSRAVTWTITGGQFVETALFDCISSNDCPQVTQ